MKLCNKNIKFSLKKLSFSKTMGSMNCETREWEKLLSKSRQTVVPMQMPQLFSSYKADCFRWTIVIVFEFSVVYHETSSLQPISAGCLSAGYYKMKCVWLITAERPTAAATQCG